MVCKLTTLHTFVSHNRGKNLGWEYPICSLTELLQSLIQTARMENVTFVYALSPGIDIIYSSEKEIKALHDKSEQVGCIYINSDSLKSFTVSSCF